MKLIDRTVVDFLNEVDSPSPAPGGGSVSGLSAALGTALLRMVGHITVDRKAFQKLTDEHQREFHQAWEKIGKIKAEILPLIDEDTYAFNRIMDAYKMPKTTDQEVLDRNDAIELATFYAIQVPMKVGTLCFEALQEIEPFVLYGNKNALSDVGVGVLQLTTALIGAMMNVKINLSGISNHEQRTLFMVQMETMIKEVNQVSNKYIQQIFQTL